ncbi:hypothetical protein GQ53DRAFT_752319 [Thozetella sp. PMI_491]|nr:hypothetical protein GQ53DRAFT_752319 [Thozetella sp. PMI_491]
MDEPMGWLRHREANSSARAASGSRHSGPATQANVNKTMCSEQALLLDAGTSTPRQEKGEREQEGRPYGA